jgi:hypothetical protein
MYSRDTGIKYRPGVGLSWPRFLLVFSVEAEARAVARIRPRLLPSTSFPMHYPLSSCNLALTIWATETPLNKSWIKKKLKLSAPMHSYIAVSYFNSVQAHKSLNTFLSCLFHINLRKNGINERYVDKLNTYLGPIISPLSLQYNRNDATWSYGKTVCR